MSVLVLLGACGPALPDEGAELAGAEPATREDAIRIPNSLSTQALIFNALTTNHMANGLLGTRPLNQLFYPPGDSYINNQLKDPNAHQLMHYLVSCALKPGQDLMWTNPLTGVQDFWHGSMGLCPEWQTQPPSQGCLERVSSCLLARNNAFGKRVELSIRGEHPTNLNAYKLENVTRPTEYDPDTSTQLPSFSSCTTNTVGVTRNCGWAVDAIGRCTPGATVRLGAGGRAPDMCSGPVLGFTSFGRMMLRVCAGIAGCDSGKARFLDESEGSCASTAPAVTFTCPAAGYYSVMKAPYESSLTAAGSVQVAAPASYRLSEAQVFTQREGAYYGNIFDPNALATEVYIEGEKVIIRDPVVHGSVYRRMYSCYDSAWSASAASSTYRVCALPSSGSNCAAKVTGACFDAAQRDFPDSMCATEDGSRVQGDGDFELCRDDTYKLWQEPLTVYLNGACDVVSGSGTSGLCQRK